MAKNTSVSLGNHFDSFITQQIQIGTYSSASEVIRAGLRILDNRETKLNMLRKLLDEGEKSGFEEYSYENLINTLDSENN